MFAENFNAGTNANKQNINPKNGSCSPSDFKDYMDGQIKAITSEENKKATKEELGRNPSDEELVEHYINNGGAEKFHDENWHRIAN